MYCVSPSHISFNSVNISLFDFSINDKFKSYQYMCLCSFIGQKGMEYVIKVVCEYLAPFALKTKLQLFNAKAQNNLQIFCSIFALM